MASAELNSNSDTFEESSSFSEQVTSPIILGSFTLGSLIFVCFWSLIVCVSAIFAVLYFIFIGSVYSFCALVDNQCFDFTVLLPAVVSRLTNKKVDLTFCKDKKEALCAAKYNQTWSFIGSFLCALLALLGLIYFLMCMTANYVRQAFLKSEAKKLSEAFYNFSAEFLLRFYNVNHAQATILLTCKFRSKGIIKTLKRRQNDFKQCVGSIKIEHQEILSFSEE
ncbi:unnamed protein product [Dracunculus medinensis]|uniref:Uncharacterized protein n=1 Tax=Dracunculus medinensis TaxID=318479 RepID=A0A0N4UCM0_DRAME|nr:unnamed protein product [Dracunculus medinensis]